MNRVNKVDNIINSLANNIVLVFDTLYIRRAINTNIKLTDNAGINTDNIVNWLLNNGYSNYVIGDEYSGVSYNDDVRAYKYDLFYKGADSFIILDQSLLECNYNLN